MADVVLQITRTEVEREADLLGALREFGSAVWKAVTAHELLVLGAILALLQIADGVLTGIGVLYFGTSVEGNPIIRLLMETCGPITALAFTKIVALGIVVLLCSLADRVWWLPSALRAVAALYLVAAIIPWSWILLSHAL